MSCTPQRHLPPRNSNVFFQMANGSNATEQPSEVTTQAPTTTVFSPTGSLSPSPTPVGPETILPVILVLIAVAIALIVACIMFRRRQIRRKKLYARQLAMTNRRIRAIGMLKEKAENELATWPHSNRRSQRQQTVSLRGEAVGRRNMASSSMSSLQSEPPICNYNFPCSVEPSRCHSANAITMPTDLTCRVLTLEQLAISKHLTGRRNSGSDLSAPINHVMPRAHSSRFASQRVYDRPGLRLTVAQVYSAKENPSMQRTNSEVKSASHTATQGSTSVRVESSNVDSYCPSSPCESPCWTNIDPVKVSEIVREHWTGTPLASEASTDFTVTQAGASQVTSQSEKWV